MDWRIVSAAGEILRRGYFDEAAAREDLEFWQGMGFDRYAGATVEEGN